MLYINGILKNWRAEGYPQNEGSVGNAGNGEQCASKNTKKFAGIKKQSTARHSDEELKKLEAELI